jgi:hypothetical protein
MSYEKDPRVDQYIDPLPPWQQAICRQVRDLVHSADPAVVLHRRAKMTAWVPLTIPSPQCRSLTANAWNTLSELRAASLLRPSKE